MGKRSKKRQKTKKTAPPVLEEPAIESQMPEVISSSPSNNWTAKVLQWTATLAAILIAWGLSAWLRLDWVAHAEKTPAYQWQGHYLPTTHDSYLFNSVIHQAANTNSLPQPLKNHYVPVETGTITLLGTGLVRYGGFHVADVITYLPVFMAGLLAVPMVLIGRLYGSTLAGCCSACLAVVAYSYFNRTNAGYFDTDMFSVTMPALILYFLLRAHREESLPWLLAGGIGIYIYPFFYNAGGPIVTALGVSFIGFRGLVWFFKQNEISVESKNFTLASIPLICIASIFCSNMSGFNLVKAPIVSLIGIVIFLGTFFVVRWLKTGKIAQSRQALVFLSAIGLVWMVGFSNSFDRIRNATISYLPAIKNKIDAEKRQEGAKQNPIIYKNPKETNIEARKADLKEFMVRISGSPWGCILALLGYLLLVILYPELIVAIPFIGIGVFALKGGHRFTIHAVPIAAMAAVFLPLCLLELVRRFMKWCKAKVPSDWKWPEKPGEYFSEFGSWIFAMGGVRIVMLVLALALIWPNIQMARERSARLGTVLQQAEVQLLDDIHKASNPGDYVHTWWDWGTAVWYHAERNVLTHPGNQSPDTFVCAKMLMTDSPRLSAHLGIASAEYYHHKGGTAVHHLFKDANTNQPPSSMLKLLEEHLPVAPTRDTYLYLPYQLIQFYSVLESFSERDLIKGAPMPRSKWIMCGGYRTDGAQQVILMHPVNTSVPIFHVDLKTFGMAELHNPVNAHNIHRSLQRGINPFQKLRFIALHLHDNQQQLRLLYAHANSIRSEGDSFVYTGVDGKQGTVKLSAVKTIYPASRIKRVVTNDPKDPTKKREGQANDGDFEKSGLSLVILQNPRLVLLADDKAYASQLMKLLVLDQPDPKYFERVSANVSGRVFRIKEPTPPDP